MLPEEFLKLCLQEFATREQAIAAAGYGDCSVLRYMVPLPVQYVPPSEEFPARFPVEKREIRLRQLPSGFWAYIPVHPNDFAQLKEHSSDAENWLRGRFLHTVYRVVERDVQDDLGRTKAEIKTRCAMELGRKFAEEMKPGVIYKTALLLEESFFEDFGTTFWGVTATLIYSEQSPQ